MLECIAMKERNPNLLDWNQKNIDPDHIVLWEKHSSDM
jgi:hypothetical protein